MIKIGIVGFGFAAQTFHTPFIQASDEFILHAVVSSRPEEVARKFPSLQTFSTLDQMLSETDVELVLITTPNTLHSPMAKASLLQGRHVILEKPMVCNSIEGQELVELSEKKGLVLSVFHNRRWDGDFLTVRQLIRDGILGKITSYSSHFDRFRPTVRDRWRENGGPGSGMWYDLGSHLVDQALCLFGMPEAITGRCLAQRQGSKANDYFQVHLHYDNIEATLHSGSHCAGPNRRFYLAGDKGTYVKHGLDPQEQQLKDGFSPKESIFGHEYQGSHGTHYSASSERKIATLPGCYMEYYDKMALAIREGAPPPVTAQEGLKVIQLLELGEKSSTEGRTILIK